MTFVTPKALWIMLAAISGAVVLAGIFRAQRSSSASSDVPLLKTLAWQGRMPEHDEQIMLRRETENAQTLLLKQSKSETVYRYDENTKSLTPVSEQAWQAAKGPIAECAKQFSPPPQALDIDKQSHELVAGSKKISTAGSTVLRVIQSPSKRWVAVLSATGPAKSSLIPFVGGGGASGDYYHQVISFPDLVLLGEPVRIPVQRDADVLASCWSADDKFVVYNDVLFAYLSVVETKVPQLSKP